MKATHSPFSYVRLIRPRLLPATIAAMSALLILKSTIMVQAVAEETAAVQGDASQPKSNTQTLGPKRINQSSSPERPAEKPRGEPPALLQPQVSDAERAILLDLRHRREAIDDRAHALDLREADITAADHRLSDRVEQLSKLQTKLEALEASRQKHAGENWTGLVKVYEAMKPREAAAIFDSLNMQVLLQVLDRMQDRRAAPVLAAMQPDRARLVTQMLAELRTQATGLQNPQ